MSGTHAPAAGNGGCGTDAAELGTAELVAFASVAAALLFGTAALIGAFGYVVSVIRHA